MDLLEELDSVGVLGIPALLAGLVRFPAWPAWPEQRHVGLTDARTRVSLLSKVDWASQQ